MAMSPEMLKQLKGKAPLDPKKGGMAIDIAVGKPAEGSPEEEASESPEEAMAEGDDKMNMGSPMDLSDVPTGALQAELDRRQAAQGQGQDEEDDAGKYFQDAEEGKEPAMA